MDTNTHELIKHMQYFNSGVYQYNHNSHNFFIGESVAKLSGDTWEQHSWRAELGSASRFINL